MSCVRGHSCQKKLHTPGRALWRAPLRTLPMGMWAHRCMAACVAKLLVLYCNPYKQVVSAGM